MRASLIFPSRKVVRVGVWKYESAGVGSLDSGSALVPLVCFARIVRGLQFVSKLNVTVTLLNKVERR